MSQVDDILFAPLTDWRTECRKIVSYIENYIHAPRGGKLMGNDPDGALLLEELCRLYHEHNQDIFFVVQVSPFGNIPVVIREIYFNGMMTFDRYEDGGSPHLTTAKHWSIRDLNLVRNSYSAHYVFASRAEAEDYLKVIGP